MTRRELEGLWKEAGFRSGPDRIRDVPGELDMIVRVVYRMGPAEQDQLFAVYGEMVKPPIPLLLWWPGLLAGEKAGDDWKAKYRRGLGRAFPGVETD
jgi:hypothetical protein